MIFNVVIHYNFFFNAYWKRSEKLLKKGATCKGPQSAGVLRHVLFSLLSFHHMITLNVMDEFNGDCASHTLPRSESQRADMWPVWHEKSVLKTRRRKKRTLTKKKRLRRNRKYLIAVTQPFPMMPHLQTHKQVKGSSRDSTLKEVTNADRPLTSKAYATRNDCVAFVITSLPRNLGLIEIIQHGHLAWRGPVDNRHLCIWNYPPKILKAPCRLFCFEFKGFNKPHKN